MTLAFPEWSVIHSTWDDPCGTEHLQTETNPDRFALRANRWKNMSPYDKEIFEEHKVWTVRPEWKVQKIEVGTEQGWEYVYTNVKTGWYISDIQLFRFRGGYQD
jgi:hypothetical protein